MALSQRGKVVAGIAAAVAVLIVGIGAWALATGRGPVEAVQDAAGARRGPDPEPPKCPLTGEDAPGGVIPDRPVAAVKVENTDDARPQAGLDRADIVYEELVEGGITRFIAMYHCDDAPVVGPVRSARTTDPDVLVAVRAAHPRLLRRHEPRAEARGPLGGLRLQRGHRRRGLPARCGPRGAAQPVREHHQAAEGRGQEGGQAGRAGAAVHLRGLGGQEQEGHGPHDDLLDAEHGGLGMEQEGRRLASDRQRLGQRARERGPRRRVQRRSSSS